MRKVLVVGSSGAGKSTFARRLGDIAGIEVIHLDKFHWLPNWTEPSKEEWKQTVAQLLARDSWIMEGNYGGTMEMRLAVCDVAIFLDLPRTICTWRVIKRVIEYREGTRPDMGEGCPERFDWEFLKWIWRFPEQTKPAVEERLARNEGEKPIYRLRSKREVAKFLKEVEAGGLPR